MADVAVITSGRTVDEAVGVVVAQLPGWRLTTEDGPLAAALVTAGATVRRRALIMSCVLETITDPGPPLDPFIPRPVPLTADLAAWAPVLQSWRDAFPVGHPDHQDLDDQGAVDFFKPLVDGSALGPLHRSSCLLEDDHGRMVAGILVNVRPSDPPWGGAWSDIWRDHSLRGTGIGPALIARAKHRLADDGLTALTLAVTAGNNARRTYERAGFAIVMDSLILDVPGVVVDR